MNAEREPAAESVETRILEIARAHLRKFGAARTTVVGVAHEAGMTHANVYRYFASKTALYEEITASWLRPIEARLRQTAEGAGGDALLQHPLDFRLDAGAVPLRAGAALRQRLDQ